MITLFEVRVLIVHHNFSLSSFRICCYCCCCCCQLLPLEQFACQWAPIRLWQSARTIAGRRAEPSECPLPCTFIRIFPYVSVLLVHCKTAGQTDGRSEGRQFVVVTLHLPRATCTTRCESQQGEFKIHLTTKMLTTKR